MKNGGTYMSKSETHKKVIELPCKAGTTVYLVNGNRVKSVMATTHFLIKNLKRLNKTMFINKSKAEVIAKGM